jgi:hypothetical protein
MSRKSDTTFGQGTIPELSTSHIGKGVALVALAAAFVYIYARIPQIEEMILSFHATGEQRWDCLPEPKYDVAILSVLRVMKIVGLSWR